MKKIIRFNDKLLDSDTLHVQRERVLQKILTILIHNKLPRLLGDSGIGRLCIKRSRSTKYFLIKYCTAGDLGLTSYQAREIALESGFLFLHSVACG